MHHVCIHKYVFVIVCDYVFLPFLAADAWICIYICLKPYLTKSSSRALGCNGLALFTFAGRCDKLAQFLSSICDTQHHHLYVTSVTMTHIYCQLIMTHLITMENQICWQMRPNATSFSRNATHFIITFMSQHISDTCHQHIMIHPITSYHYDV